MPELQLEGLPSERVAQDLMPQADAEDRGPADELADLRLLLL
jgi:hypothetical protein